MVHPAINNSDDVAVMHSCKVVKATGINQKSTASECIMAQYKKKGTCDYKLLNYHTRNVMNKKTNILFFLFPFRGHSIQAIKIIKLLNDTSKYNILVDIGDEYEELLPACIERHSCLYKFKSNEYQQNYEKDRLINYAEGVMNTVAEYRQWFSKSNFKPNFICFDSLAYWGKIISEENGIKSISLHTIQPFDANAFSMHGYTYLHPYTNAFANKKEFQRILHIYEKISIKKHDLKSDFKFSDVLCAKGNNNIVLVPEYICKYRENLNDSFKIYNPILDNGLLETDMTGKKQAIYIATGSIIKNSDYLCKCINSLIELDFELHVSSGELAEELRKIYINNKKVHIYNFAPQIELLKKCKLFITHGGMNSICESIYCETPMVVIPFINDEYLNAKMVEENGIGMMLTNDDEFETKLMESVINITNDKNVYNKIQYYSQIMKSIDTDNEVKKIFENITQISMR